MGRTHELERDESMDARAFYLQESFRAILDAMARPGEVRELPAPQRDAAADTRASGLMGSALVVADTLIDAATAFSVAAEDPDAADPAVEVLARRTHARVDSIRTAPFVFVPGRVRDAAARSAIASLSKGTLADPQLGATAVVECGTLLGVDASGARSGSVSGAHPARTYVLNGPGIKDAAELTCDRADVIEARLDRADEFPCGIDIILVDGAGHVACLPRTTRIESASVCVDCEKGIAEWDT